MEYIQAYFPPEAYEDHAGLVRCLQQWLGYCLTGENRLEKTMWLYGEGSNGKSQLIDMLAHVLGKDIHAQIPMASLCKVCGVNNDALYDARQARHVTISESDSTTKISEAAFHSIVSGEVQSLKTMWKKTVSCKSNMKMTFSVNTLPTWDYPTDLCSTRRNIYVPLKNIYIDPNDAPSMKLANEYRAKGLPECLIAPKNLKHFNTKVCGHETSFLRFMVLGSKAYYKQGNIEIPPSLNAHQCVENLDKGEAVENYVSEHLRIVSGEKLLMRDILVHFRATSKIEAISVKDADFAPLLWAATLNKGAEWTDGVQYHNNKMKDGRRGMAYMNVAFVHLETGIRSFTEITPRHLPILDKEAAVQDHVAQNLRMLDGEKTRMCDILAHFRATAKIAEKLLTDREFSGLLLNAINNTLDWQYKIDYRNATVKGEKRCMMYKNLGFVDCNATTDMSTAPPPLPPILLPYAEPPKVNSLKKRKESEPWKQTMLSKDHSPQRYSKTLITAFVPTLPNPTFSIGVGHLSDFLTLLD